jgi:hypothetical protein
MRDGVAAGGAERCAADDAWALLMLMARAGVLECWRGCCAGAADGAVATDGAVMVLLALLMVLCYRCCCC